MNSTLTATPINSTIVQECLMCIAIIMAVSQLKTALTLRILTYPSCTAPFFIISFTNNCYVQNWLRLVDGFHRRSLKCSNVDMRELQKVRMVTFWAFFSKFSMRSFSRYPDRKGTLTLTVDFCRKQVLQGKYKIVTTQKQAHDSL